MLISMSKFFLCVRAWSRQPNGCAEEPNFARGSNLTQGVFYASQSERRQAWGVNTGVNVIGVTMEVAERDSPGSIAYIVKAEAQ